MRGARRTRSVRRSAARARQRRRWAFFSSLLEVRPRLWSTKPPGPHRPRGLLHKPPESFHLGDALHREAHCLSFRTSPKGPLGAGQRDLIHEKDPSFQLPPHRVPPNDEESIRHTKYRQEAYPSTHGPDEPAAGYSWRDVVAAAKWRGIAIVGQQVSVLRRGPCGGTSGSAAPAARGGEAPAGGGGPSPGNP